MKTYQVVTMDSSKRRSHFEDVQPILETDTFTEACWAAKEHHEKYNVDVGIYMPKNKGYADVHRVVPDPAPAPNPLKEFVVFWAAENRNLGRGYLTKQVRARMKDFDDLKKAEKLVLNLRWAQEQDETYQSRYVSNIEKNF